MTSTTATEAFQYGRSLGAALGSSPMEFVHAARGAGSQIRDPKPGDFRTPERIWVCNPTLTQYSIKTIMRYLTLQLDFAEG